MEDCNAHYNSLSQFDSTSSVNFAAYDHRQNKGRKSKKNRGNGKDQAQNKTVEQRSSNSGHQSRKPPWIEDKCMRSGKHEHQPKQKCPAKNAKCKECHKIGHFCKVYQNKKRAIQRIQLAQAPKEDDDTHIDEVGHRKPNPPRVNILKVVYHIEANRGKFNEGKHLKFPIASHSRGPYNHHIIVRVDTGADANCMNENTFKELFPEVKLSVCPHKIQNFRNSVADISILGQFQSYLQLRGEKYLNAFIVTDANDCPNLLTHGTTFRMGVLLPNYPKEIVVEGQNVPHFSKMSRDKMRAATSPSNVFHMETTIGSTKPKVKPRVGRTTTPSKSTEQMTASGPPAPSAHVHKPPQQVLKPRDLVTLQKVKHPPQW